MSTSSLYGTTGNVTVSANNLTTLYNATGGNIVTANVPDRDFTTLYTTQVAVNPTYAYGNSNVEAFLNAGTDGANTVQNIIMTGNLTVGGTSNLGPVSNVHITGGNLNYVLKTDGAGNLQWTPQLTATSNSVPYIHFNVANTGNNQQFTDTYLANYASNTGFNLFKNGVNIEPTYYQKVNGNTVQVNILLNAGDTIDILATGEGTSGGAPGGSLGEVQYNGGSYLSGNSSFTFDQPNSLLTVGNVTIVNSSHLGNVSNVHIQGGNANMVLQTDGTGNLSWVTFAGSFLGGANTQVQFNDNGVFNGNSNFTYDKTSSLLTVAHIAGEGGNISNVTAGNINGIVANANYAANSGHSTTSNSATSAGTSVYADTANTANIASIANVAYSVSGANVSGIVANATFADYSGVAWAVAGSNVSGYVNNAIHANVSDVANTVAGANVTGTVNNATTAATVTANAQPNITSTGTLSDLTIGGNLIIQRGYERFSTVGTGATGTINFNILDQSILYYSANATGNVTLNVRGNSTVTFDSSLPTNDTVTLVFLNTVGVTPYVVSAFNIDGAVRTVKYVNGYTPASGTRLPSALQSYTYTIVKTATNTYTVLGSLTEYQ